MKQVVLNSMLAEFELVGDLFVAQALSGMLRDLDLSMLSRSTLAAVMPSQEGVRFRASIRNLELAGLAPISPLLTRSIQVPSSHNGSVRQKTPMAPQRKEATMDSREPTSIRTTVISVEFDGTTKKGRQLLRAPSPRNDWVEKTSCALLT
jgi:hypothetical protein